MVVWWQIVVTIICILLSGTFSGLTLGLMSLEIIDLRVLLESGSDNEKWYARRILPVRKHANWLLCTLLIGNTAVNSALAIVTAELFGGIEGFLSSTVIILYIGEIIPQAVCHRFGLIVGAYMVPFVKLLMILTAPLSFTTAKALDFFLGGEPATRYNKSQLKSLLSFHGTMHNPDPQDPNPPPNNDSTVIEISQPPNNENHSLESDDIIQPKSPPLPTGSTPTTSSPTNSDPPEHPSATADKPIPDVKSRSRTNPVATICQKTFSCLTPSRRRREKRDKEKDSISSNPPPLTKDEVTMLGGAFDFSQKTVAQVMTSLDDVFMLEASLSLNFDVLLIIFQSGHSRVPVYDNNRDNIIGILFAKDLILLDPEDSVPIKTVLLFFNRSILLVAFNTPLNEMLNIFRRGGGHMAMVQEKKEGEEGEDDTRDTLGVVTLEDLIEELIGKDIVDETDVYTDNINKQRVKRIRSIDPDVLKMFDSKHDEDLLSHKEVLVVSSYLCNNVAQFATHLIDLNILRKMLAEITIVEYGLGHKPPRRPANAHGLAALASLAGRSSPNSNPAESNTDIDAISGDAIEETFSGEAQDVEEYDGSNEENATIYTRGVPTKNAYLIINGRLEISAGSDGFISEAGPWTLLGLSALTDDLYAPDFTAKVIERPARLLRISRRLYRQMLQFSAKTSRPLKFMGSAISSTPPNSGPRAFAARPPRKTHSSSSLALQAAAAAVALGNPSPDSAQLTGTTSDVQIVHKSHSRANGQSIEWSELEPSLPKEGVPR